MKGVTSTGFEYEVKDSITDDMELVELLAEIDSNPLLITKVIERILGKEQKEALYDHMRDEDGTVRISAVESVIGEIFTAFGDDGKNL